MCQITTRVEIGTWPLLYHLPNTPQGVEIGTLSVLHYIPNTPQCVE